MSIAVFHVQAAYPDCVYSRVSRADEALNPAPGYQPLLSWGVVNERMAWGVLLLMGGGFALADGCQVRDTSGRVRGVVWDGVWSMMVGITAKRVELSLIHI